MLESKKPSQLIKKLQSNEFELKVNFLDDSSHIFNVKVSSTSVECRNCGSSMCNSFGMQCTQSKRLQFESIVVEICVQCVKCVGIQVNRVNQTVTDENGKILISVDVSVANCTYRFQRRHFIVLFFLFSCTVVNCFCLFSYYLWLGVFFAASTETLHWCGADQSSAGLFEHCRA